MDSKKIIPLLEDNQKIVSQIYRRASTILQIVIFFHVVFIGIFLVVDGFNETNHVIKFAVFNFTVLCIEVLLFRAAFMLGSRDGQLKDIMLVVAMLEQSYEPEKFEILAKGITSLRRDSPSLLKMLDVEKLMPVFRGK